MKFVTSFLAAALLLAAAGTSHAAMRIEDDHGGQIGAYITKFERLRSSGQSVVIKAGYMIGVYGNDKTRSDLIDKLGSIDNAAVRFVASQTIDYLSPKGSKEAADALEKIIDKNTKTADKDKIAGDAPLKQIMYRIRARAE